MADETVRTGVNGDPTLDDDSQNDPQKGATIGGIGGAVAGALTGSMAGPLGTLAGAVIGGIVGAVTSKAAVGVIDKLENDNSLSEQNDGAETVVPKHFAPSDAGASPDGDVLPDPMPVGSLDSFNATDKDLERVRG